MHILLIHERKKPFQCNKYYTSFTPKQSLERHIEAMHEGQKSFRSNVILDYSQTKHEKIYSRLHESQKPFTIFVSLLLHKNITWRRHILVHESKSLTNAIFVGLILPQNKRWICSWWTKAFKMQYIYVILSLLKKTAETCHFTKIKKAF